MTNNSGRLPSAVCSIPVALGPSRSPAPPPNGRPETPASRAPARRRRRRPAVRVGEVQRSGGDRRDHRDRDHDAVPAREQRQWRGVGGRHRPPLGRAEFARTAASGVGFLGGAAAFLLGVLMLASIDHYYATRSVVDAEAVAYCGGLQQRRGLGRPGSGTDSTGSGLSHALGQHRLMGSHGRKHGSQEHLTVAGTGRGASVGRRAERPPPSPTAWISSSPNPSRPPSQGSNGCWTETAIFRSCCGFWCTSASSCWSS